MIKKLIRKNFLLWYYKEWNIYHFTIKILLFYYNIVKDRLKMEILKKDNIVKVLIAIIIILGVIFIIVGERPRHKAEANKTAQNENINSEKAATAEEVTPPADTKQSAQPTQPQVNSEETAVDSSDKKTAAPGAENTNEIDGKKLIHDKYQNSDMTFMQHAIDEHNAQKAREMKDFAEKNSVNSEISESGISTDAANLSMNKAEEEKIAQEEGKPSEDVKSLTSLSNPDIKETDNVNPAIAKAEKIQYENPQKYATSTALDASAIYAVNTETAETYMLKKGDTEWRNLGKPEGVSTKPIATYTLEGANADSAVVLDTSTAEAWRVSLNGENISWNVIKPFADKE